MKKSIITFSRRTDPAFHMRWLMERLEQGECSVPNPFSGKDYTVSLKPENVHLLNFWTKAPGSIVPYMENIIAMGYSTAFFITQTGYPSWLEKAVPPREKIRDAVIHLSNQISPHALWWRYDPIIFTSMIDAAWHRENFTGLCEDIWQKNTKRVIISLAHIDGPYAFAKKRLMRETLNNNDMLNMPSYNKFIDLALELAEIAGRFGIEAGVCCSPKIKEEDIAKGIKQTRCLSLEYLKKIIPGLPGIPYKGTRKGSIAHGYAPCGCVESRDIGTYGTCRHGCVYCYAARQA